ncbi:MAG: PilZ domain-containing protein [Terriglobia bacterium]|jgi:hypothetical protein
MTERRDSERLLLKIPIRVTSFGGSAGSFSEETYTVEINRAGARIALQHRAAADDTIRIVNLQNLREADFRVIGASRLETGEVGDWGVECLETERNIWDINFSSPIETGSSQAGALLECKDCGTQSFCTLQTWELDALESGSMQRLCQTCGGPTEWRYVDVNRRVEEVRTPERAAAPAAQEAPIAPAAAATPARTEKRAYRRLALKLPILVRDKNGDQEVAKTENVSKGGVAVGLGMELEIGDLVTICCPYVEGGQNMEQKAEIRHRETFFIGQRWIYGMRFM